MEVEYGKPGYENMFWDDVVNKHITEFKLHVHPVEHEQIVEIDTVAELEEICRRLG
jgi:CTP:phosphocholine cytidylyltransferase-like protein